MMTPGRKSFTGLWVVLFVLLWIGNSQAEWQIAHSGHSKETSAPPEEPTIYSVGDEAEESIGDGDPLLGNDLLGGDNIMPLNDPSQPGAPMEGMSHEEHSGHGGKPHIELSSHKMVSTSSKGYGVAVAITVLAGMFFGFLLILRPKLRL